MISTRTAQGGVTELRKLIAGQRAVESYITRMDEQIESRRLLLFHQGDEPRRSGGKINGGGGQDNPREHMARQIINRISAHDLFFTRKSNALPDCGNHHEGPSEFNRPGCDFGI